jgi:hypothetical protein
MKKTKTLYWIFNGLFAGIMGISAIPDIIKVPDAVQMVNTHFGYPVYFLPFIGVAKLLGAIAILMPGYPRIKEWAYAGLAFDLIAATYSAIAIGDPASQWILMIIFFLLFIGAYGYYHKKLAEEASNIL